MVYVPKGKVKAKRMRKRVIKKKPTVTTAIKTYVNRAIHRNVENKGYQIQWSQNMGSYASNNLLYAFPMTPYTGGLNIGQGVTQSTRIGNQIKPRKLSFNFVLSCRPWDAVTNPSPQPCEIELYICSLKAASGEMPTSVEVANLYQLNATSIAPSGQIIDATQNLNTEVFKIHKRMRFKLGYAIADGTGFNAANQSFANNDFKLNVARNLDLTKYCPKTIVYNDNAGTPTSRCVFAMWNILPSVGGTSFASTIFPVRIDSTISLSYEDA